MRLTVSNGERHCVSNNDHTSQTITADLTVGVYKVVDAKCDARGVAESCAEHGNDQSEPIDLVGGALTWSAKVSIS